jgi:hypothetical protein
VGVVLVAFGLGTFAVARKGGLYDRWVESWWEAPRGREGYKTLRRWVGYGAAAFLLVNGIALLA